MTNKEVCDRLYSLLERLKSVLICSGHNRKADDYLNADVEALDVAIEHMKKEEPTMTVRELIAILERIPNKNLKVHMKYGCIRIGNRLIYPNDEREY